MNNNEVNNIKAFYSENFCIFPNRPFIYDIPLYAEINEEVDALGIQKRLNKVKDIFELLFQENESIFLLTTQQIKFREVNEVSSERNDLLSRIIPKKDFRVGKLPSVLKRYNVTYLTSFLLEDGEAYLRNLYQLNFQKQLLSRLIQSQIFVDLPYARFQNAPQYRLKSFMIKSERTGNVIEFHDDRFVRIYCAHEMQLTELRRNYILETVDDWK